MVARHHRNALTVEKVTEYQQRCRSVMKPVRSGFVRGSLAQSLLLGRG
jgi:hypothetical protein